MVLDIYMVGRTRTKNGNPVYRLLIPKLSRKVKGLRKLKMPNMYSIQSFSLSADLKNFVFKGRKVKLHNIL